MLNKDKDKDLSKLILEFFVGIGKMFFYPYIVYLVWNWQFDYVLNYWQCFWLSEIIRMLVPRITEK